MRRAHRMHVDVELGEPLRECAGAAGVVEMDVGDCHRPKVAGIHSRLTHPREQRLQRRRGAGFDQRRSLAQQEV